jgi:hypothetical protein
MSHIHATTPPDRVDIALKEWAGIVQALGEGVQSILLRKGGIDEGTGGFLPEHPWFWFYPTAVHQAQQGVKPQFASASVPAATPDSSHVPLRWLANVVRVERLDDLDTVDRLDALHAWTTETIHARFSYRKPGLWLMGVRVYAISEPISLPITPDHTGCRSWVPLASPLATLGAQPVLDDAAFAAISQAIDTALG